MTDGSVTGEPQTASVVDVSEHGYVEEEYFVAGEARPLATFTGEDDEDDPIEPAAYKTRVLVYRPERRRDFNGTLVANWPNVTLQVDVPTIWINCHEYLMRKGYAAAVVSAQKVGVDDSAEDMDLVSWDPERYGDLHHPGDTYAFDIFSQAVRALRRAPGIRRRFDADTDPLGGHRVRNVLGGGLSQSGGYTLAYLNTVQEHAGVVDGFLPLAIGAPDEARDDLVPVILVNTEDEAGTIGREDGGLYRHWEVAGASHVNYWLSAYFGTSVVRDFEGVEPEFDAIDAGQYGEREDGVYGECEYNYYPVRYAYNAALDSLHEWVRRGREPPTVPRIEREDGGGGDESDVTVVTDEYGNARGGLRLPPLEVPVATYDARADDCGGYGMTHRFDDETLDELYPTRRAYVAELKRAVRDAVGAGYLLQADGKDLLSRATNADLGAT